MSTHCQKYKHKEMFSFSRGESGSKINLRDKDFQMSFFFFLVCFKGVYSINENTY